MDEGLAGIGPHATDAGRWRRSLDAAAAKRRFQVFYPELEFCTDNGAMIAFAGALRLKENPDAAKRDYAFNVRPRWPLDELRAS
jgi:N6-L-threonylcarbamoyladenine synthase